MSNKKIIFKPGKLGIKYAGKTITTVSEGSQAEKVGVKVGWKIISINSKVMPDDKIIIKKTITDAKDKTIPIEIVFMPTAHKMSEEKKESVGVIMVSLYRIDGEEEKTKAYKLAEVTELSQCKKILRKTVTQTLRFGSRLVSERAAVGPVTLVNMPEAEDYNVYVQKQENGLACVIVVDENYPRNTSLILITKTLQDYEKKYPKWKEGKLVDKNDSPTFMKNDIKAFQDPTEMDKLHECLSKVEDLKKIAEQNIDEMLKNGEDLDQLINDADELGLAAKTFVKTSKKANRRCPKCVIC